MKSPRLLLLPCLLLAIAVSAAEPAIPLLKNLGSHTHPVTTQSPEAQRYFDQGLRFVFGFNHGAAIKSFQEAARLDPACAMAHWGIALASGPHINFPVVPPPAAELAWAELQLAREHAAKTTPVEQALIEALSHRYANPQPEDRGPLDLAYANAMRAAWKQFPQDADVGVFFAEAMMDLRPWDQWTPAGQPQPGTEEILATLDAVLKLDLNHPFANHLYVHALEASHQPERALPAADRLLNLQPGLAHNVHMPSHIYIRTGQWHKAVESNRLAVAADRAYREVVGPAKGFLPLYVAHNEHMLAYAAMMTGQREVAMQHIRALVAGLPPEFLQEFDPGVEAFLSQPLEVLVRFGRWDEILAEPMHPATQPFTHAFQFAARGIALAAKGDTAAARREQALYAEAAKAVGPERTAGNNSCATILGIVTPMLEGEILVREGKVDDGLAQLRAAVAAEDQLHYDEPPGWMIPVRHSLGAVLMAQKRYAEAEEVYRADLARLPNNGWSLFGLSEALMQQGRNKEVASVRSLFKDSWQKADLTLTSSCLCQPGR
ncbi:MAG TPA: tetratricopeptide repeat protein [Lacunisphaera sp.]|nr:tetratricopeptide repeat protein [Lacunisphaera sp.]